MKADRHTHTLFSDGRASPEAMLEAARAAGFSTLAITDHMPLPFATEWAMEEGQLSSYRETLARLKERSRDRINLLIGMEMDYLPTHAAHVARIAALGWEWLLGSVHFGIGSGPGPVELDASAEAFAALLQERWAGDIRALCTEYYGHIRAAGATGLFDALGHFDLVKKFNREERFFSEAAPWYRALVLQTLDSLAAAGQTLEVNTSGYDKPCGECYPSLWIIAAARERGIPLVLDSDAHCPEAIGRHFDRAELAGIG